MLTCAVIAQSLALDCTGFYKIVCYVRYIQICDRVIWQPACDFSTALQIALGPQQNKKNQFSLHSMVHVGELGQIVSAGA